MSEAPRRYRIATPGLVLVLLLAFLAGCDVPGGSVVRSAPPHNTGAPTPDSSSPSTAPLPTEFPNITGREFDQSLRNGQATGGLAYPKFGRLLAATQTGGPTHMSVDLSDVHTSVIGIFMCKGRGKGPVVALRHGSYSVLWFKSSGCDPGSLYGGQSERLRAGTTSAKLTITVPTTIQYSFVLEEVAAGARA